MTGSTLSDRRIAAVLGLFAAHYILIGIGSTIGFWVGDIMQLQTPNFNLVILPVLYPKVYGFAALGTFAFHSYTRRGETQ